MHPALGSAEPLSSDCGAAAFHVSDRAALTRIPDCLAGLLLNALRPTGAVLAKVCLNATAPIAQTSALSYVFRGFFNMRINAGAGFSEDMFIDPRGRTPGESAALISANISNTAAQVRQNTFNFTVQYTVGQGYVYILTDAEFTAGGTGVQANLGTTSLNWTVDTTGGGAGGVLNNVSPVGYHNAILLKAFTNNTINGESYVQVNNVQFTAEGATSCGSLTNMFASSNGTQLVTQWLISDSDLADTSWTVTGQVELERGVGGPTPSWTQFDIYTVALVDQAFTECRGLACQVSLHWASNNNEFVTILKVALRQSALSSRASARCASDWPIPHVHTAQPVHKHLCVRPSSDAVWNLLLKCVG